MELYQYHDVNRRGTIERLTYTTKNQDGTEVSKYANVYLPFGYSAERQYPVLYLVHGGGGNQDSWLDSTMIKNVLDFSFAEGRCEPFITVFPRFYDSDPVRKGPVDEEAERACVLCFQRSDPGRGQPLFDEASPERQGHRRLFHGRRHHLVCFSGKP